MDWDGVIERNTEALRRILAMLVAMAGPGAALTSPQGQGTWGDRREASGGGSALDITPTRRSDDRRPPLKGEVEASPPTLPRRLHRAILRLLRPLESATRRLIIVMARDLPALALPASGVMSASPALSPKPSIAPLTGTRIVKINFGLAGYSAPPPPRPVRRTWSLPIADPRKRFGPRRRYVPPHAAPRILSFDRVPHRLPPPPSPHDLIDATRLALRLAGISRALADLPAQARRYVRWKSRNAAKAARRLSPLRPGRAPGWRKRSKEEINEILADLQYFAREVLRPPDTS